MQKSEHSLTQGMHTIVVGSGPVGVRFVQEMAAKNVAGKITLFGNEPGRPYNRVQLSSLLAGEIAPDDIQLQVPDESDHFSFIQSAVSSIDPSAKQLIDQNGKVHHFDRLVIVTGARAHVPNIEGLDQTGVYTFRSLKDAEHLYARTSRARHIVIVGGGLLGLETAKALLKNNTQVSLIQQGEHLMNRQLDEFAADILKNSLLDMGVRVMTNIGVREIIGSGRVTAVVLRNGDLIECDTVVFCSGITPNIEIARSARIRVNRGILVDDRLQTSHPSIYAIGECCEHNDLTYGIVNPGYEQASVLADVLSGGESLYSGSLLSTSLKVIDTPVRSVGDVVNYTKTPFHREYVYSKGELYRKLVTHKGRLVGAMSIGAWSEDARVQEAFLGQRKINFLQRCLFKVCGRVWPTSQSRDVSQWPKSAVVCQCSSVTQGEVVSAIQTQCSSIAQVSNRTRAGAVCGSCKPLLLQLIESHTDTKIEREKEWAWAPMLVASLAAFVISALILSLPGIAVGESVTQPAPLEFLWNDKFWKKVTGFTLLGLSVVGLLMSLRKRLQFQKLGMFAYWRLFHIALGVTCAVILLIHTGLHIGDNLNRLLMFNFLAVLIMGGIASSVISLSHRLKPINATKIRSFWSWAHIVVTWPLPILLAIHILTVFYF